VVEGLRDALGDALGDGLAGLYLSGSLALGGFDPPSSDIDVLVGPGRHRRNAGRGGDPAAGRPACDPPGGRRLGGPPRGCVPAGHDPAPLRPQRPDQLPNRGQPSDFCPWSAEPNLGVDLWIDREHGLVIAGPRPSTLIDPIGPLALQAAVRGLLLGFWAGQLEGPAPAWLRPRSDQAFAVLSRCRALYCLEYGRVVSKPASAAWASRRLGPPWPELVARALGWRADQRPDDDRLGATLGPGCRRGRQSANGGLASTRRRSACRIGRRRP
jgi:hypothetical protein